MRAYVCGDKAGLILEEPYKMGETLTRTKTILDIGMEKKVIEQKLEEFRAKLLSKKEETKAMKELGLERARMFGWPNVYVFTKAMGEMLIGERRENLPIIIVRPTIVTSTIKEPFPGWVEGVKTVDSYFAGFGLGKITFFLGSSKTIMDVIPGDMVVNATMAAMVAHGDKPNSRFMIIYQVGSSNREPMYCSMIKDYAYNHFAKNPLMSKNGKLIKVVKPYCFTSMNSLQIYMDLKYNFPLKGLRLAYAILRHDDGGFCTDMEHQVKFVTKLAIN
ncbi:fatty acyl-CoA reductase 3-like isoform X3 [Papaver somniferum]|uniref:fatty acyl-CoA reductase 3-like isoform X3 n=1 Tax=Papaver somniferum TaxID=3469 RepID=UPI000E6F8821|nr:fatty acyl-CoA reductase 3-like isoform X3 [Papaver somniferum]